MLGNDHFYHRSIRKVVVTFGSLFNDIEVIRFSQDETPKERFKVPLSFGTKEKYLTRISSDPTLTKSVSVVVPRMAFFLNSFSYDHNRKQVTTLKQYAKGTTNLSQYIPVPYNFEFSLSIFVRNTEDGTQILEQILPFFTPDFTVTIDFIPSMNKKYDVPFILESVNSNIDYEGDMSTVRLITWDLTFTAKGYIFPPVKDSGIIREVNANILNIENSQNMVNVNVVPDPITAEPDDEYGFAETITEI